MALLHNCISFIITENFNHTCSFHERSGAGREGGEVQERWREEGDIFPLTVKEWK